MGQNPVTCFGWLDWQIAGNCEMLIVTAKPPNGQNQLIIKLALHVRTIGRLQVPFPFVLLILSIQYHIYF